jgi:CDP-diacylglycerol--glycerol-3-phosphate 3-phosphatidyltransferase
MADTAATRKGSAVGSGRGFGPTALATPANAVTMARLLAAPVFAVLVVTIGPSSWALVGLWAVLAGSDAVDGHIARQQGATRSGAFLDPLADKCLVLSALGALAAAGVVSWLPVALIAAREVAMSVYRAYAGREGVSIPARPAAKLKTAVQDVAVLLALIPAFGGAHHAIVTIVLWFAVALTIWSGIEYLHDGRRLRAASRCG